MQLEHDAELVLKEKVLPLLQGLHVRAELSPAYELPDGHVQTRPAPLPPLLENAVLDTPEITSLHAHVLAPALEVDPCGQFAHVDAPAAE